MSRINQKRFVSFKNVKINDPFWTGYQELVRNTVIPYNRKLSMRINQMQSPAMQ